MRRLEHPADDGEAEAVAVVGVAGPELDAEPLQGREEVGEGGDLLALEVLLVQGLDSFEGRVHATASDTRRLH